MCDCTILIQAQILNIIPLTEKYGNFRYLMLIDFDSYKTHLEYFSKIVHRDFVNSNGKWVYVSREKGVKNPDIGIVVFRIKSYNRNSFIECFYSHNICLPQKDEGCDDPALNEVKNLRDEIEALKRENAKLRDENLQYSRGMKLMEFAMNLFAKK